MLVLRPYHDPSDFIHLYRMNINPQAMHYIRPAETSEEPVRARIDHTLAYAAKHPGYGIFIIEKADTQEVLGNMIIRHANWDGAREVEIGYVIDPVFWGNGYGTAAIQLLLEYGQKQLHLNFFVAFTDAENGASNKVLQKNGFVLVGEERIYDADCLRWEKRMDPL